MQCNGHQEATPLSRHIFLEEFLLHAGLAIMCILMSAVWLYSALFTNAMPFAFDLAKAA